MHMGSEDITAAYVMLRKSSMDFAHIDEKTSGEIIAEFIKRKDVRKHSLVRALLAPFSQYAKLAFLPLWNIFLLITLYVCSTVLHTRFPKCPFKNVCKCDN